MKKRSMKKWIPKNTCYCGKCPYLHYVKIIKLDESNCEYIKDCKDKPCWTRTENSCKNIVYKCDYLNYVDWKQESLLWDGCKECEVS